MKVIVPPKPNHRHILGLFTCAECDAWVRAVWAQAASVGR